MWAGIISQKQSYSQRAIRRPSDIYHAQLQVGLPDHVHSPVESDSGLTVTVVLRSLDGRCPGFVSVAVIKYPNKRQLRVGGFILAHS